MDQAASQLRCTLERCSGGVVHVLSERGVGYRLAVDMAGRAAAQVEARLCGLDRRVDAAGDVTTTLTLVLAGAPPALDVGRCYLVGLAPVGAGQA